MSGNDQRAEKGSVHVIELIEMVESWFNNYHVNELNRSIWLTLQTCMNKIIEEKGDNKYKIPHMNKERLGRLNQLPISFAVTQEAHNMISIYLLTNTLKYLQQHCCCNPYNNMMCMLLC
jgi:hypothetical protein